MKQIKIVTVQESASNYVVDSKEKALEVWDKEIKTQAFFDSQKEHLIVIVLNTKLKATGWNLISIGSLNEAIAHPREIFRPVIASAGYAFILMHNHPSNEAAPSQADRSLTSRLRECANILQINFIDHVITAGNDSFSFREAGIL